MRERFPSSDDLRNDTSAAEFALPRAGVPQPSKWKSRRVWIKRGLWTAFALFMALFAWLALTAPLSRSLKPMAPPRITLLAANGQPIAQKGAVVDRPVKASELPATVKQAFIAIEDRRFYTHWGVDPRGMLRAAWNNARGGGTQGGSTITQQLAKMTFLSPERNLGRKAREMLIAFWLEGWLTKDQILERYLSNAYFGDNVYGLRAASLRYFNRQPERLTLAQGAMLAGLVQAPSRLAPSRNLAGAQARSRLVLGAMAEAGFITAQQALETPVAITNLRNVSALPTGTYFADWAMPQARALTEQVYGDTQVTTTLDARMQKLARAAVARAALGNAQVALVAMRPNGEVVAMIGGRSYDKSPFNRATQARRQPGSTFKLFVYLAALRSGMTPDTLIDDSPIVEGGYRPKNSSAHYRGEVTLRQAFARSSNVAAVRLYQKLGPEAIIQAARDLGVSSPLTADPTLALGSSGVTLLELTSAYASVAANDWPVAPHGIPRDEPGLFERLIRPSHSFDGPTLSMMRDLLRAVIVQGTGRGAALAIEAFGKTGTSQDNRDALFVGYAGDLIVGVWVGNDDNTPLKGIHGGGLPAKIWRDFMGSAIPGARPIITPVTPKLDEAPPETDDLPFGLDNMQVKLGNDSGLTINTQVAGVPLDVKLDQNGLSIQTPKPQAPEKQ
ncbi:penicillin-binding protein [Sphingomonas paeninsulae]|uniref:Penicillin-binding protein n=1 Tax=Sphingomonas paeninsulae TaxID=2319844 RepID=A0A494TM83_SPHPE|nr:transglycosylase domain-containing protein [Sphingomonas paeninsulae]AYJ86548.1 penicillin-binding protein [Sphingomonas paeninsulae]